MSDTKALTGIDSIAQAQLAQLNNRASRVAKLAESTGTQGLLGAKSAKAHEKEIESAATQFESLLVHEMLKSMWESVPKEGMLSASKEEELYRDMLNEELANQIAEHQSIGVKDVIISDIKKTEGHTKIGTKG